MEMPSCSGPRQPCCMAWKMPPVHFAEWEYPHAEQNLRTACVHTREMRGFLMPHQGRIPKKMSAQPRAGCGAIGQHCGACERLLRL